MSLAPFSDARPGPGLRGVWGTTDEWLTAAGDGFVYDPSFTALTPSNGQAGLNAIYANPTGIVYAVGLPKVSVQTIVTRLGKQAEWQNIEVGTVGVPTLYGVWVSGNGEVYTVGSNGALIHYDAAAWSNDHLPDNRTMRSVNGFAADNGGVDVIGVGDAGTIVRWSTP